VKARYFNPYTDFGFKKLFGEEANKNLLIDFLNQLLPSRHKIVHLSFKNKEQIGDSLVERKAIFDIYCENDKGERFIVEMQKEKLKFFKDRAIFYTTFPIREQTEKGDWDFKLLPVYCVAILDFTFDEERGEKRPVIRRCHACPQIATSACKRTERDVGINDDAHGEELKLVPSAGNPLAGTKKVSERHIRPPA